MLSSKIDFKFINYSRDEDGIDIWITNNSPIHLEDEVELLELIDQLQLVSKQIEREPF